MTKRGSAVLVEQHGLTGAAAPAAAVCCWGLALVCLADNVRNNKTFCAVAFYGTEDAAVPRPRTNPQIE